MSALQGGKFLTGAVASAAVAGASLAMDEWLPYQSGGQTNFENIVPRVVIAASVGGTVSSIAGGKFGNGAVAGAFAEMLNGLAEAAGIGTSDASEPAEAPDDMEMQDADHERRVKVWTEDAPKVVSAADDIRSLADPFDPAGKAGALLGAAIKIKKIHQISKAGVAAKAAKKSAGEVVKEVGLKARIAESGITTSQAGNFFGWGSRQITKPLSAFTRESLEAAGWNAQKLSNVAAGYERLAAETPNPSTALRAEQLRNLAKLFE